MSGKPTAVRATLVLLGSVTAREAAREAFAESLGMRTAKCAALSYVALAAVIGAQEPAAKRLRAPDAAPAAEFSHITAVRELRDGTVLVADGPEERLVVLNLERNAVRVIGRKGSGPGEFASVRTLVALSNDSTLLPDMANGRWLLFSSARIAVTLPVDDPTVRFAGGGILGAADDGHVLTLKRLGLRPLSDGLSVESLAVVRVHRGSGRADTLARIRSNPVQLPPGTTQAPRNPLYARAFGVAMTPPEQARLFPDGWVALARLDPYRVDWHAPDGRVVPGRPLPYEPVRIDEREKRAYAQRLSEATGRNVLYTEIARWPATGSPFDRDALLADPAGILLVRRQPSARDTVVRYDLVDRTGALVGRLHLPLDARMVGFGARSAYVSVRDDDGMERIRRHPWPPS